MRDLGLLLLRIVAGITLAAHGYPKLFGGPGKQPHPLLARTMGPNYPAAVERGRPAVAFGQRYASTVRHHHGPRLDRGGRRRNGPAPIQREVAAGLSRSSSSGQEFPHESRQFLGLLAVKEVGSATDRDQSTARQLGQDLFSLLRS